MILHQANQFLTTLSSSDLALLQPRLREVDLVLGECLNRQGEEIAHVIFPRSGSVSIAVPMRSGQTPEAALVGREGVIGFQAAFGVPFALSDVRVHASGKAMQMPVADFQAAAEKSASLRDHIFHHNALLMAQMQQSTVCNASHTVEERMCRWLLEMLDRTQSERLALTQQSLAQTLGVRRTTVTLVAGHLQVSGAIKCRRGHISVLDRAQLEAKTCECYDAMKRWQDRLFGQAAELDRIPLQVETNVWTMPQSATALPQG